jgi:hypothetical protein
MCVSNSASPITFHVYQNRYGKLRPSATAWLQSLLAMALKSISPHYLRETFRGCVARPASARSMRGRRRRHLSLLVNHRVLTVSCLGRWLGESAQTRLVVTTPAYAFSQAYSSESRPGYRPFCRIKFSTWTWCGRAWSLLWSGMQVLLCCCIRLRFQLFAMYFSRIETAMRCLHLRCFLRQSSQQKWETLCNPSYQNGTNPLEIRFCQLGPRRHPCPKVRASDHSCSTLLSDSLVPWSWSLA